MGTKFHILRGIADDELMEQANEAMADIESKRGKYVASHWSTAARNDGFIQATLVIVYEEGRRRAVYVPRESSDTTGD
jgi:hypothetical protein